MASYCPNCGSYNIDRAGPLPRCRSCDPIDGDQETITLSQLVSELMPGVARQEIERRIGLVVTTPAREEILRKYAEQYLNMRTSVGEGWSMPPQPIHVPLPPEPEHTYTDGQSPDGITVTLIESMMAVAGILMARSMKSSAIQAALNDLRSNEAMRWLMGIKR